MPIRIKQGICIIYEKEKRVVTHHTPGRDEFDDFSICRPCAQRIVSAFKKPSHGHGLTADAVRASEHEKIRAGLRK